MASIVFDPRRGSYFIQWFDGTRWTREKVYRLERHKAGSPRPKTDPLPVTKALAAYKERERAAKRGKRQAVGLSLAEFLESYEAQYSANHPPGTVAQLRIAFKNFKDWVAANGVTALAQVTPAICNAYLLYRSQQSAKTVKKEQRLIKASTIGKERAYLSGAWKLPVKLEQLDRNPWHSTELPGKPKKTKRPSFSPEEYKKLTNPKTCALWLRDLIAMGCHTGLRISALLSLTFDQIHSDGKGQRWAVIVVPPENDKAGKGYEIPVHPVVREIVERKWKDRDGKSHNIIITGQAGRPIKGATVTRVSIHAACKRAGVAQPISPNHAMRRTFGRWAVLGHLTGRPVPVYIVSRWLGHSSISTTLSYLDIKQEESVDWMSPVNPNDSAGHSPVSQ